MTHYIFTEDNLIGTLNSAITSTQTTGIRILFVDRITGEARTPDSNTRLFTFDKGSESSPNPKYEQIYAPGTFTTNATGDITLNSTGLIRGAARSGYAFTAVTANQQSHAEGTEVGCSTSHFLNSVPAAIFAGLLESGANTAIWGDGTNTNLNLQHKDGSSTKTFIRKNPTSGKVQYSDDGSSFSDMSTIGAHGTTANLKDHIDVADSATDSPTDGDLLVYDTTNKWENQTVIAAIGAKIQNQSTTYAADAQASDTYVITLTPAPAAYAAGQRFSFKANTANTGACTLNVNSLGAKTIKKFNDQDLETGDIEAGQIVTVEYDGTNLQMTSPVASQMSTAASTRLTGGVASNADQDHTHLFNKKIGIKVSPVTVGGTTSETAIVAATSIPAGTLGTTQGVRVRVNISALLYATGTLTLRFKYGSTTVISSVLTPGAGTIGVLEYELYANASASAQIAFGKIFLSTEELSMTQTANQIITHPTGTASEASAGALNVTVTAQWSSSNAGNSITAHSAVIETIQAA